MKLIKNRLHIMSVFMIIVLSLTILNANNQNNFVNAKTLDQLQQEYGSLESKQEEIQRELNKTKQDIESQKEYQSALDSQIEVTERQIQILLTQISELETQIQKKNHEIEVKQIEIDKNYEIYKSRLRAGYMGNNGDLLSVLLTSKNLSDLLRQTTVSKKIAEHDTNLLNILVEQKKEVEDAKQEISKNIKTVELSKVSLDNKTAELNSSLSKSAKVVANLQELGNQYQRDKERIDKDMAEVEDSIQKLLETSNNGEFVGGMFAWPVPGYTGISSGYGWRSWGDGSREFHKGIDISGSNISGKNVVASNAGRVILAFNNDRPGVSYGKYIIVDHGGGYSSLYGHNSALLVKEGDWVRKGQPIAKVGSTGWSTGPHLHFEIRINGNHVNPMNYLTKK